MAIINSVNDLNERITVLEVRSSGPLPGAGEEEELFSCWAHVKTSMIKDIRDNAGTYFQDTTTFVIRYQQQHEITNKMKLRWKGKSYDIVKYNIDTSRKEFDVIVAKENS